MSQLRIGIVLGSTRVGRFADRPAEWLLGVANKRGGAAFEIVDLRDYPMPFFDAPKSPLREPPTNEVARRWARKVAELDGYVFVTAEYNRSISAVLKNALDHIYFEPARKPAAFVGYGAVGAAHAVEQLRLMTIELNMVAMKSGVHINMEPMLGLLREGRSFGDFPYLAPTVTVMLDELSWYARTLKAGRDAEPTEAAAA
jgi:NAD(P)H-dependent FMN reductase